MIAQCAGGYPDGSGVPTLCIAVIESYQPSEALGIGLMICLSPGTRQGWQGLWLTPTDPLNQPGWRRTGARNSEQGETMTTIVVLFNLKAGANRETYEQWARDVDIPNVRRLDGVGGFEVLRSEGLLGGSPDVPYAYVELIQVDDMDRFMSAVGTETMQEVAAQFGAFTDDATFMVTKSIE